MKVRVALTVVIMLAVAGCGLIPLPRARTAACPSPDAETRSLTQEAHGYCLLYPAAYLTEQPNPDETVLFVGSLLNVEAPRAFIEVRDAAGRTAPEFAAEIIADLTGGQPGWDIQQRTATIGGEPAIVLDNLPGQDINRQVVVVHGDRLYRMTFVPADPAQGEVYAAMERLYRTVTDSFRFTS